MDLGGAHGYLMEFLLALLPLLLLDFVLNSMLCWICVEYVYSSVTTGVEL